MSGEDNLGLNADNGVAPIVASAENTAPVVPEQKSGVPQEQVNDLVRDGWSRGYKKAKEEFAKNIEAPQNSGVVHAPNKSSDDYLSLVQTEVQRQIGAIKAAEEAKLKNEAVEEHTNRILGKIKSLADKDPNIESKIFEALPPQRNDGTINKSIGALYVFADQVPNTGEVLKHLAENEDKADKILAAMERNPDRAFKKLQELSEALIAEKVVESTAKTAAPPLSAPTKNKVNVGGSTYLDRKADILRKYRV